MSINFKKITIATCLSFSLSLSSASASTPVNGEYTQDGYITYVTASNSGENCFLGIGTSPLADTFQGGTWYCGNITGQNLLNISRTAMVMQLPVSVILNGNGSVDKPVYSVSIKNK
ncbi:hypothetical protein [Xanthomonas citri]|uniref:hypothetical protein n=1 Tax=Xanthomonas citri TaxID=346 RepID=UPI0001CED1FF|nr:hypothetical protein [Xanthomonas citri]EFF49566.1 hypothetical protein XAUC_00350 [Xanthomonas citri pv. aurantifolii str. ICPB 10535]MCC8491621.1 hypothetical protein [Xanthomonas citri pv. fuscans]